MAKKGTTRSSATSRSASKQVSRPAPTKVVKVAVAPHPRTMSNGQPRPKKRG